jgi:hypothetical protein
MHTPCVEGSHWQSSAILAMLLIVRESLVLQSEGRGFKSLRQLHENLKRWGSLNAALCGQ